MEKKEGIIKLWMNTEFTENYQKMKGGNCHDISGSRNF